MAECCQQVQIESQQMKRILWIVLWINAIVFCAQFTAAIIAHSTALLADSFDMIGDVFAYAISLYALSRGQRWLVKAALFKGFIIAFLATLILFDALYKIFIIEIVPSSFLMLIFSLLGLFANSICLWLLTRYRENDINMRSVWLCARNDIIGNISVLITACLVYLIHSHWPDVLVGMALGFVLMQSAYQIIQSAKIELAPSSV